MYRLKLSNRVTKQLDKLEKPALVRVYNKLKELESNPMPPGCLKLTNQEAYRIRIGDYRVVYEIINKEHVVYLFDVMHRKDNYRKN